jgi:hypothetical protein
VVRYLAARSFDGYMWQTKWAILHRMQQPENIRVFSWCGGLAGPRGRSSGQPGRAC